MKLLELATSLIGLLFTGCFNIVRHAGPNNLWKRRIVDGNAFEPDNTECHSLSGFEYKLKTGKNINTLADLRVY